jgi:septal ring factor EnvC (AmiA/AmiB activator)
VSKIEELDKLDKAIKDADIRLKSIQSAIEQIDKEISVLGPRKTELEQNIQFHKKQDTIPIAHEYKKSKSELSKIKARLILINADRGRAKQACIDIEQIIEKFKRDHLELIKTSENNVLRPIFGGKHGKS